MKFLEAFGKFNYNKKEGKYRKNVNSDDYQKDPLSKYVPDKNTKKPEEEKKSIKISDINKLILLYSNLLKDDAFLRFIRKKVKNYQRFDEIENDIRKNPMKFVNLINEYYGKNYVWVGR